MSELCEFTKTQASEARQRKQTILNGIEAMGNNIAKAINAETQAMSAHVDVLNQASLDAIMNKLNTSSYAKETSRPHTTDYTTPSESPSTPHPEPESSRPKDEKESKHSPPTPMPPGGTGPNTLPSQTPDQHPGDIHTGQILVAEVVVADDRQPGETRTTIQVWTITRKRIERGIALPLVALLHQPDTTGASLTCLAGTQIPNAY
jgi:hypothetical protein